MKNETKSKKLTLSTWPTRLIKTKTKPQKIFDIGLKIVEAIQEAGVDHAEIILPNGKKVIVTID